VGAGLTGGRLRVTGVPDLLRRLVAESRAEVEARRAVMSAAHLERLAAALPPARDLRAALRRDRLAVIAEMKARTPIMGRLSEDYSPGRLAGVYVAAGAAALSVLCQETSFGGRPSTWPRPGPWPTCRSCARTSRLTSTRCWRRGRTAPTRSC
jgi:hypothetical protein